MRKLVTIIILGLSSFVGFAQEAPGGQDVSVGQEEPSNQEAEARKKGSYFISTNSGIQKTPVGIRFGVLNKVGAYLGTRFGKGYSYAKDKGNANVVLSEESTLVSVTAGLIFPISVQNKFGVHALTGVGYGKWFDRLSSNGQTVGGELELGVMLSVEKVLVTVGASALGGDGNGPIGDLTIGLGYRF
jgi:hypothetical protein